MRSHDDGTSTKLLSATSLSTAAHNGYEAKRAFPFIVRYMSGAAIALHAALMVKG